MSLYKNIYIPDVNRDILFILCFSENADVLCDGK